MSITNKIQCNITKLWYGISQDRKEKLIKKHGSEENLIKNYICRDARNLIKQGYAKDKIPNLIANKNLQPKQHNQRRPSREQYCPTRWTRRLLLRLHVL